MIHHDRERLRETFNLDAELYDRVRPGYPMELFSDLADLAGVGPGCRVLEIGCGTGQLTVPLAKRGCEIVAVDLGSDMAAVASHHLRNYPSVQVIVAPFEDWPLPARPFDVVVSATAFHWLDPAVRVIKSAEALRPDGVLATVATHHIAGGDEDFFVRVQRCYEQWKPSASTRIQLQAAAEIPMDSEEISRSGRFGPATFQRYEWEKTYSATAYCELLLTYSDHRALASEARQGLLDCVANLIESQYSGQITKRYLTELRLARRSSIDKNYR